MKLVTKTCHKLSFGMIFYTSTVLYWKREMHAFQYMGTTPLTPQEGQDFSIRSQVFLSYSMETGWFRFFVGGAPGPPTPPHIFCRPPASMENPWKIDPWKTCIDFQWISHGFPIEAGGRQKMWGGVGGAGAPPTKKRTFLKRHFSRDCPQWSRAPWGPKKRGMGPNKKGGKEAIL